MKKPPQKGSVAWIEIPSEEPAYEGMLVGIQYVGAKAARQWSMRMAKFRVEEVSRLEKLRKAHRKETAPELWELSVTPEGIGIADELVNSVLAEAVAGLRGVDGLEETDKEAALELLHELDLGDGMMLLTKAIEMQSLSKADQFLTEGPS